MQLHLNYHLEPDSAPLHAAAIVEVAADISDAELDYSPGSIGLVEDIVDGFRSDGATGQQMADSLVAFGCYVGEILTRHAGAVWRYTPDSQHTVPLVVELPDARECHPIDWVFRRLEHGADVSICGLYAEASLESGPAAGSTHG
ncbi:DUF3806 domain-containing protein [Streptomyces albicerus]|uniref:DUF3806 domain-containing protein n=1 Tax=Streptomyces albicerus TaxID=2569859 RepID=UPI00124B19FD|nr:DUF3806 domain-containing protein [Streptomyces albicerus]